MTKLKWRMKFWFRKHMAALWGILVIFTIIAIGLWLRDMFIATTGPLGSGSPSMILRIIALSCMGITVLTSLLVLHIQHKDEKRREELK